MEEVPKVSNLGLIHLIKMMKLEYIAALVCIPQPLLCKISSISSHQNNNTF